MKSKYSKKLVFDYINGNDIEDYELDELEDDYLFMIEVIKITRDKNMYLLCSDQVKKNYEFVKFMVQFFMDDKKFIHELATHYLSSVSDEDSRYMELVIFMSNLDITENDIELFLFYRVEAQKFYLKEKYWITCACKLEENQDLVGKIGMGFVLTLMNYSDSDIIMNFFASKYLHEIFYENEAYTFEKLIHSQFKKVENLEQVGIVNYIINYVKSFDQYLAHYISSHLELISSLKKDICFVMNAWDSYMARLNQRRVAIVYQEVDRFWADRQYTMLFSRYAVLEEIIRDFHLEDVFDIGSESNYLDKSVVSFDKKGQFDFIEKTFRNFAVNLIEQLFRTDVIHDEARDYDLESKEADTKAKILKVDFTQHSSKS